MNVGDHAAIQLKPEFGRKPGGSQHAHWIFQETRFSIADNTQYTSFQICQPTGVIHYRKVINVVVQRINGKIPAPGIVFEATKNIISHN